MKGPLFPNCFTCSLNFTSPRARTQWHIGYNQDKLPAILGSKLVSIISYCSKTSCPARRPSTTIHPNDSEIVQNRNDERLFCTVHQLVLGGSLTAAYQRLTEPGLCQTDPLPRFLEIHRDIDLTSLNLHLNSVQEVRDNLEWNNFCSWQCISTYSKA
jgi:hypothetical protein